MGKVVIFGSCLTDKERVGDIDLAIRLVRRPEFTERWPEALLLTRADAAANRGRRFRGFLERLAWPETEVKRYLRGGARALSLHNWTKEEPSLQHAAHKVLFEGDPSAAPAKSADQKRAEPFIESQDGDSAGRRSPKRPRRCPF